MQTRSLTDQRWGDPCELDGGGVEFGVRLIVDVACGVCDVSVIAWWGMMLLVLWQKGVL